MKKIWDCTRKLCRQLIREVFFSALAVTLPKLWLHCRRLYEIIVLNSLNSRRTSAQCCQELPERCRCCGMKLRGNIHKNDLGSATNREHTQRCDSNHQKWLFSILNCSCHGCWCHKANTAVKAADRKMVLFNGCLITMSQHHPGAHHVWAVKAS